MTGNAFTTPISAEDERRTILDAEALKTEGCCPYFSKHTKRGFWGVLPGAVSAVGVAVLRDHGPQAVRSALNSVTTNGFGLFATTGIGVTLTFFLLINVTSRVVESCQERSPTFRISYARIA